MSSRQLRKLQQQRELEEQAKRQEALEAEEEEEEEEDDPRPAGKASLFANLAMLEDEEEAAKEESEEEHTDHEANIHEPSPIPTPATGAKKTKKSKKKKKKAKNATTAPKDAENPSNDQIDEIDKALKELRPTGTALDTSRGSQPVDLNYEYVCKLVAINAQHFRVANEMRNLFGKAAIENHDDAGGPVPRGGRRRQRGAARQTVDLETALKGHHPPGKGLPELTLRRNPFIQGKDTWPKATTGGLSMEIVEDQRDSIGEVEFRFVHSKDYNDVQLQFHAFVEIGEPQNLIGLLQRHPYNISLLLQVSKIAKNQTDNALASDLVERALFTFGRASLSLFATKLAEGKARLDFARPENREFFLAIYHYIQSLMMKGTYRTAFEWAKLLWALDAEDDSYCALFMIHDLALRAGEFQYVLDTYGSPKVQKVVEKAEGSWFKHASPSLALAAMYLKEGALARKHLEESIKTVPWIYVRLFQEANLDTPPPSIWGAKSRTEAEELFCEIYVSQTKDLWNTPEATSLLMEVTHAMSKVDTDAIPIEEKSSIDLNIARFVYLGQNRTLMSLVPSILLHHPNTTDSDPLPPSQSTYSYATQSPEIRGGLHGGVGELGEQRGLAEAGDGNFWDPVAGILRLIPDLGALLGRGRVPEEDDDDDTDPAAEDFDSDTDEHNEH